MEDRHPPEDRPVRTELLALKHDEDWSRSGVPIDREVREHDLWRNDFSHLHSTGALREENTRRARYVMSDS